MGSLSPQELSACLLYDPNHYDKENHLAALEHRQQVVRAWGIPPGASVLEIGPGQGDLTVVLADAVGRTGRVVAVDNAPLHWGTPDYASAQAHVRVSPVGHQITFVQADPIAYLSGGAGGQTFDFIVFGYSIWYFSSPDILKRTLQAACQHVRSVLIAEYSLSASHLAQVPHVLTALAANALESFRGEESKRNIRCALSPRQITSFAADAGWALAKEEIATPLVRQADARNEAEMVLNPRRLFRKDLDEVVSRTDLKIGIMLRTMLDAVAASVGNLEGGVDSARNMDVWIARFERGS
ncbi:S-adenosyl-L-methionine-dependent methyltransferase [Canariomyces notabilis]|uniref:S-adenosyl-L-methionine-dependent methyltransferase n=1 Tax=Canariomyces notabilis TaxID=2074819 RepID=A0AAN6QBR5_9PEZI|nr:S-adenosyl-L-methionine-dependent methyltransferase [Canariomyces arenarius]